MKSKILFLIGLVLILPGLTSCRLTGLLVSEIDPGKFYRSGQLLLDTYKETLETYKIKTVINLRGEAPGKKWFDEQFTTSEDMNIRYVSIDMKLNQIPHRRTLLLLLDTLATAEWPMLVLCDTGIERTGEVSALYQMLYMNKSREQALEMLSKKYSYVDGKSDPSKKYFISQLWQNTTWAEKDYDPCTQNYLYYDRNQSECVDQ